jgi:hypothetical protein
MAQNQVLLGVFRCTFVKIVQIEPVQILISIYTLGIYAINIKKKLYTIRTWIFKNPSLNTLSWIEVDQIFESSKTKPKMANCV